MKQETVDTIAKAVEWTEIITLAGCFALGAALMSLPFKSRALQVAVMAGAGIAMAPIANGLSDYGREFTANLLAPLVDDEEKEEVEEGPELVTDC